MVIQNKQKANAKVAVVNPSMSTITLNMNGLNSPIKSDWKNKKQNPTICCPQEAHFSFKDTRKI